MVEPNTPQDLMLYEPRDVHALKDINVYLTDGAEFNIWGEANLNGEPLLPSNFSNTPTIDTLRDVGFAYDFISVYGFSSVGDGGDGVFYWDDTDTTSDDDTGVVIRSNNPVLDSQGRWKRIHVGTKVNTRWFGVHPSNPDNTENLQNAIDYTGTREIAGIAVGGDCYTPSGYHRCLFLDGLSGLDTILQAYHSVTLSGDGDSTQFVVDDDVVTKVEYFFTFSNAPGRGFGGGAKDFKIIGNAKLDWGFLIDTWHEAEFKNLTLVDEYMGCIDLAASVSTTLFGEGIKISGIDRYSSSGTNSVFSKYGIRFRAVEDKGSFTDSWVSECMFVNVWHRGLFIDGCHRIHWRDIGVACNSESDNTIDGLPHAGVEGGVEYTNSVDAPITADTGYHDGYGLYYESHEGSETIETHIAVRVTLPVGATGFNRATVTEMVTISPNVPLGLFSVTNEAGVLGEVAYHKFRVNQRAYQPGSIVIGANVDLTYIEITGNRGTNVRVTDAGTRTYVNNVTHTIWGQDFPPSTTPTALHNDVGQFSVDTNTGRVAWIDRDGVPHRVSPTLGKFFGAQRISALATPAAPVATKAAVGATTWTYYVVAIDKDGNKTPPSAAGSATLAPASLAGANKNIIRWQPVEGAVAYDLLRGASPNRVIALSLKTCVFDDDGVTDFAYTASATNPPATLTVDDYIDMPEITAPAAPAANSGRTFMRDNGSGKTQYCVRFPTGAIQVLATEP